MLGIKRVRRLGPVVGVVALTLVATACTGGYFQPVTASDGATKPVQRGAAAGDFGGRPRGMELCFINLSGLRNVLASFDGGPRTLLFRNQRKCADSTTAPGEDSVLEVREDVYMGAPPGYSKITFRSVLGQRGTEQLTWVHLSFTKAGGEEVQLPVLPHLGAAWSIDTLFEGWGLTSVKFIWDDMTPDGRPRVTMSFR